MILSDFVAATYLKAVGKRSSLTSTDEKYLKIVAMANAQVDAWQREADWSSQYDGDYPLAGTVTATNTFAIPEAVRKLSDQRGDYVRIYWADGETVSEFAIVPVNRLQNYDLTANVCAQNGSNLIFQRTFATTDGEFGGTIKVPVYLYADELDAETGSQEIPVDIPRWLVTITAAEYIRNDVTKQNQYPNLIAEANTLMERMKDDNDAQIEEPYFGFTLRGRTW